MDWRYAGLMWWRDGGLLGVDLLWVLLLVAAVLAAGPGPRPGAAPRGGGPARLAGAATVATGLAMGGYLLLDWRAPSGTSMVATAALRSVHAGALLDVAAYVVAVLMAVLAALALALSPLMRGPGAAWARSALVLGAAAGALVGVVQVWGSLSSWQDLGFPTPVVVATLLLGLAALSGTVVAAGRHRSTLMAAALGLLGVVTVVRAVGDLVVFGGRPPGRFGSHHQVAADVGALLLGGTLTALGLLTVALVGRGVTLLRSGDGPGVVAAFLGAMAVPVASAWLLAYPAYALLSHWVVGGERLSLFTTGIRWSADLALVLLSGGMVLAGASLLLAGGRRASLDVAPAVSRGPVGTPGARTGWPPAPPPR